MQASFLRSHNNNLVEGNQFASGNSGKFYNIKYHYNTCYDNKHGEAVIKELTGDIKAESNWHIYIPLELTIDIML